MEFRTITQAIDELGVLFGLAVLQESKEIDMKSQFHTVRFIGAYIGQ